eukprot:Skav218121  [mRNA]  locus=scaffold759:274828:275439:- [translate_table: standard]
MDEAKVGMLQGWARMLQAVSKLRVRPLSGSLEDHMPQLEEPIGSVCAAFTGEVLGEAVQERVRTRAYYLYVDGCNDEKKNYFQAQWRLKKHQDMLCDVLLLTLGFQRLDRLSLAVLLHCQLPPKSLTNPPDNILHKDTLGHAQTHWTGWSLLRCQALFTELQLAAV